MSKLPAVRARDAARVAQSLGFVLDRQRGSHAVYYRSLDRKRVVIPMHPGKDLKPGTLRGIITDMGLTPEDFIALVVNRLTPAR
ncbi:MAG: type II toxin-antitoxin system HicA family toxin [Tepidisphaeraceae bacterium]